MYDEDKQEPALPNDAQDTEQTGAENNSAPSGQQAFDALTKDFSGGFSAAEFLRQREERYKRMPEHIPYDFIARRLTQIHALPTRAERAYATAGILQELEAEIQALAQASKKQEA